MQCAAKCRAKRFKMQSKVGKYDAQYNAMQRKCEAKRNVVRSRTERNGTESEIESEVHCNAMQCNAMHCNLKQCNANMTPCDA
jgi:hypothetical protein